MRRARFDIDPQNLENEGKSYHHRSKGPFQAKIVGVGVSVWHDDSKEREERQKEEVII